MSRIELRTGGGHVAVVYDGRQRGTIEYEVDHGQRAIVQVGGGDLIGYDGTRRFHARMGGHTWYTSWSGLSRVGAVPGLPGVARVAGYRADVGRLWLPRVGQYDGLQDIPKVFGRRLLAPYDYGAHKESVRGTLGHGRAISQTMPVIDVTDMLSSEPAVTLVAASEINQYLLGALAVMEQAYEWTVYHPTSSGAPEAKTVATGPDTITVMASAGALANYDRRVGCRRAVEEIMHDLLRFAPADRDDDPTPQHWRGMRLVGDWVYRIRGGRAVWARPVSLLTPGALDAEGDLVTDEDAREELDGLLPDGLTALSPHYVVGESMLYTRDRSHDLDPADELRLVQTRDVALAEQIAARPWRGWLGSDDATASATPEQLAEWERELLAGA